MNIAWLNWWDAHPQAYWALALLVVVALTIRNARRK